MYGHRGNTFVNTFFVLLHAMIFDPPVLSMKIVLPIKKKSLTRNFLYFIFIEKNSNQAGLIPKNSVHAKTTYLQRDFSISPHVLQKDTNPSILISNPFQRSARLVARLLSRENCVQPT